MLREIHTPFIKKTTQSMDGDVYFVTKAVGQTHAPLSTRLP